MQVHEAQYYPPTEKARRKEWQVYLRCGKFVKLIFIHLEKKWVSRLAACITYTRHSFITFRAFRKFY